MCVIFTDIPEAELVCVTFTVRLNFTHSFIPYMSVLSRFREKCYCIQCFFLRRCDSVRNCDKNVLFVCHQLGGFVLSPFQSRLLALKSI
jgi:hypothetical protein